MNYHQATSQIKLKSSWFKVKMKIDILITGTGSLAEEILFSLIKLTSKSLSIHIFGRNIERLKWLKHVADLQNKMQNKDHLVTFSYIPDWEEDSLVSALHPLKIELILHTASVQSAWMLKTKNKWNSLVNKYGYGITTFLQCHLALKLGQALISTGKNTPIINASYPDVTNFILHHHGVPVIAGIGNTSIIDALLTTSRRITSKKNLFFYAHHYHISQLIQGNDRNLPEIYYGNEQFEFFSFFPEIFKLPADESLNKLTGFIAASQILSFLGVNEPYIGHMPGVNGLLGGQPVQISKRKIEIRSFNKEALSFSQEKFKVLTNLEGINISENSISFNNEFIQDLQSLSIKLPTQINLADTNIYSELFLNIKESLSGQI